MRLNDISKETFFTPEELAEKLKLSIATVYKLLSQDKLPYFKVGKSYRIPARAFASYMMGEGNLSHFVSVGPEIPRAAYRFVELVDELSREVKDQIIAVILFGSYARGDHDEHSDIDLLVLLKDTTPELDVQVAALSSEAMAAGGFDEFLSPLRMSIAHWIQLARDGSPLYEEIQREGVLLWSKGSISLEDIEIDHARN